MSEKDGRDERTIQRLTCERDEARDLVLAWRRAFLSFATDPNAFLDCFYDVLNQSNDLIRLYGDIDAPRPQGVIEAKAAGD